ncbi:hypothetical protein CAMRE0001_1399 [Campylobacter rectus RM3267]|uniref:Uncharacterized protein n=1 Tax=Campylobacter rectus RM3267 TaxID=553218 RepID=B9D084_CAMRE|nr:hypothetical protein CAMRE0001_1399 [Campylobacter rectus RM3267]
MQRSKALCRRLKIFVCSALRFALAALREAVAGAGETKNYSKTRDKPLCKVKYLSILMRL